MKSHSILWERLDLPGHEICRMTRGRGELRLRGTAVFAFRGLPCALAYSIVADGAGRTRAARVEGVVGTKTVDVRIASDRARRWRLNGRPVREVEGCDDVDLNFSPSTNTLPILRLRLARGSEAAVRSAWLRFPDFTLRPLDQFYRRTGPTTYRYRSSSGFSAALEVDAAGLVTRYGRVWKAVGQGPTI